MSGDLLLLTDRSQLRLGRGLVRTVLECAGAGLARVVVREHDLAPAARAALVARLRAPGLQVLGSHALLPGADGVHLADGAEPADPRAQVVGRSCHDLDGVRAAVRAGADYVTLSPFAATLSKPGHGPPVAPRLYAAARAEVAGSGTRLLALGGVGPGEVARALDVGAHGVAVMGGVMRAPEPSAVVSALLEALAGAS